MRFADVSLPVSVHTSIITVCRLRCARHDRPALHKLPTFVDVSRCNIIKSMPQNLFRRKWNMPLIASMCEQNINSVRIFRKNFIVQSLPDLTMPIAQTINRRILLRKIKAHYFLSWEETDIFRPLTCPVKRILLYVIVISCHEQYFCLRYPRKQSADFLQFSLQWLFVKKIT